MKKLLTLIHASWERPHRILDAFDDVDDIALEALAGDSLPPHEEIAGVVAMGGPMNVDDIQRFPALGDEREWIAEAVRREIPVLGICLGAQLLARALGAEVRPGEAEVGFAPVRVTDPTDQVLGALAPSTTVLHWHGDIFDLPDGAQALASSAGTEHQAFRFGNAWGVLFHPEADASLIRTWLEVPEMAEEARRIIGSGAAGRLLAEAEKLEPELLQRTAPGLCAFAELVEAR